MTVTFSALDLAVSNTITQGSRRSYTPTSLIQRWHRFPRLEGRVAAHGHELYHTVTPGYL
jgi:hypothetical protein